jgi:uncharacterized protein (TIGR04255 family)
MSDSLTPLPNFENPPVVEVALSVQFEPLPALKVAHLGHLWSAFREDGFTRTEDHGNLESVHEPFDPRVYAQGLGIGIKFRSLEVPPVPRVWFLNDAGTELIQVQQDRFIHNWRKAGNDIDYVRYPHVRERFVKSFDRFEAFVAAEKLGQVKPDQCEVTYTNQMVSGEGWETQGELDRVFTFWRSGDSGFLPPPENASVAIRYLIPDDKGKPIGRLHVDLQPAFRKSDFVPMLILNLTARGAPLGRGPGGVMDFFDLGREWIVRGFAGITTSSMHSEWRRIDVR